MHQSLNVWKNFKKIAFNKENLPNQLKGL